MNAITIPTPTYIKTTGNVSIPPYSEANIKITLPSTRGPQCNAIAKPAPTFLRQKQLIGCHCLINNLEDIAMYRVCNPTEYIVSIPRKTKIAIYEIVEDQAPIRPWTKEDKTQND
jgi:hypothetical protein